jgi:hypothetical protein
MAEIQALVDAAVAAALFGMDAAPPAGGAPAVLAYARNPAQASTGLLNYKSSKGMKIYNSATAALPTKYSGNAIDMHIFLKGVKARGETFGWNNIVEIPTGGVNRNITDQYGLIRLEDISAHAMVYENVLGRDAQNSAQMYKFLLASLTTEAMLMVLFDSADYSIMTTGGCKSATVHAS